MTSPWNAFSHWGSAQEHESRPDRAEQGDADQAAGERPAPAGYRDAPDDHGGDDLELQPHSGVGVDIGEADGVKECGQSRQRAGGDKDAEYHAPRPDAREPGGFGIGPRGVDRSSDRKVAQAPGKNGENAECQRYHQPLTHRLARAKPLKSRRQIADEGTFARVPQRLPPDYQGRQSHHDRRQAQPRDEYAVDRAKLLPARSVPRPTTAMLKPARESSPATTPQMLKIEPIEMSMCRQRMTRVMPTAATRTDALLTTISRSWSGRKKRGAATARTKSKATYAAATDSSRR